MGTQTKTQRRVGPDMELTNQEICDIERLSMSIEIGHNLVSGELDTDFKRLAMGELQEISVRLGRKITELDILERTKDHSSVMYVSEEQLMDRWLDSIISGEG